MAKKTKKRRSPNERGLPPLPDAKKTKKPKAPASHQASRETIEALVIALVLAFLFRTFQAEAFVIPTGSMAPTLMGYHKDVYCPQCGQRFKVNASDEGKSLDELAKVGGNLKTPARIAYERETIAGQCQNCRYPMPFTPDLPSGALVERDEVTRENSSSGDRILVNKYLYSFTDPQRWDVVVFKYPGDAVQNYIKRLVGLPGETLRLYQGDVYSKANGSAPQAPADADDFRILRKPADKVLAMRQLVHDTRHDPASLYQAGWPLRWSGDVDGWRVETTIKGKNALQTCQVSKTGDGRTHWLRYSHLPATPAAWRVVRQSLVNQVPVDGLLADHPDRDRKQLITDFNSYNTEVPRWSLLNELQRGNQAADIDQPPTARGRLHGIHWVGDLSLDLDVRVLSNDGQLLLDLVEAGQHFRCKIDVATGEATLKVLAYETGEQVLSLGAAQTKVIGPGSYRVRFANVDDQLLLWVGNELVSFDGKNAYDAQTAFGQQGRLAPKTGDADAGDLAPVSVGSRGAELAISRLQVFRDLYYIADKWIDRNTPVTMTDYPLAGRGIRSPAGGTEPPWRVSEDPALWPAIADRRHCDFEIGEDQLFVMGDNSSSSKDCRVWTSDETYNRPGGLYLERSLLTGKAVCVYWPHALVSIPTPKRGVRIPIVPNLGDIRLVR